MFSSQHSLSLFSKSPSLQFNLIPFFSFWSGSKIAKREPDLVFIDQSAVWPTCGAGLAGFCLLGQGGKCTEYTQNPGRTNTHRSALTERQQALRTWVQQLLIQQSHLYLYVWARSFGVSIPIFCRFWEKHMALNSEQDSCSYSISSSSTVCNLTEVFLPKVTNISYLSSNIGLSFSVICVGTTLKCEFLLVLVSCWSNKSRVWKNKQLAVENMVWAQQL